MYGSIRTEKRPGDFVLGECGRLYIVNRDGTHSPHEQPHRRTQRLIAEAWRASVAPVRDPAPRRSLFALFGAGRV